MRLVDAVGAPLFEKLSDGDPVTVRGGTVIGPDGVLAEGRVLTVEELTRTAREQQHLIGEAIQDFAENTLTHIREEGDILAGRLQIPDLSTEFRDRHALIVVRGTDYRRDLRMLRPYIRDLRPVLVGVDGGGDALLEAGLQARHGLRRHGLRLRPRAEVRRRARRARLSRRHARPDASGSSGWASSTRCCPRRARARTSRCWSPSSAARA